MYGYKNKIVMTAGQEILNHIIEKKLTIRHLSESVNLDPKHIALYLNDSKQIPSSLAIELAKVLGKSARYWSGLPTK